MQSILLCQVTNARFSDTAGVGHFVSFDGTALECA